MRLMLLMIPFFLLTTACHNSKKSTETVQKPVAASYEKIWVNSYMDNCSGNENAAPFLLTQQGEVKTTENWDCNIHAIDGFEFEPGYFYQLEVETYLNEGLPAYRLKKVISKERDPEYFRIHDIWALTAMNGKVIEITEQRPNIEVNLTNYKIMGKAFCNSFFGEITSFTKTKISFGPIGATKMMCPDIKMEDTYFKALNDVTAYEINKTLLELKNSTGDVILTFKKVD